MLLVLGFGASQHCPAPGLFHLLSLPALYDGSSMKYAFCLMMLPTLVWAEVESHIPWGVEAVTGYRSELVHRGFKIADDVFDFQLESEVALSDDWSIGFGANYATGTGTDNDFSETSGFLELRYDTKQWSAGWIVGYRDFDEGFFEDGWETGPFYTWNFTEDLNLKGQLLYDEGAESFYATVDLSWSKSLSAKSYVAVTGGVSIVDDFYESEGFHAASMRVSYTYLLAPNVSITPFLGTSLGINEEADDSLFGGAWFEVTF